MAYAVRMDGHTLLAKLMHKRTGEALPALSALKLNNDSLSTAGVRQNTVADGVAKRDGV